MKRRPLLVVLLIASFMSMAAEQQIPRIASPRDAVRMLGDRRFATREAAMRWLWEAGERVEELLNEAATSSDREVASRAKLLLDRLALGIRPDTPAAVIREIRAYRQGDERQKADTLKRLLREGRPEVAVRLIQFSLRQNEKWIEGQVELVLPHLVLTQQGELAEKLLRQAAATGDHAALYRAFLVVTGRIEQVISEMEQPAKQAADAAKQHELALLYRARGDMDRAIATARLFADKQHDLLEMLLSEHGDYSELAERLDGRLDRSRTPSRNELARFGYLMAFHDAAGHTDQVHDLATRLLKWKNEIAKSDTTIERLLLTNGRFNEALPMLKQDDPLGYFNLLTQFERWDDAFAWLGAKSQDDPELANWFDARLPKAIKGRRHAPDEFEEVTEVCRVLNRLGARELSAQYLDKLVEGLLELPNHFWTSEVGAVIELELQLSLRDQAFQHAEKILSKGSTKAILSTLYPDDQALAVYWWNRLREESKGDPYAATLSQLREVLDRKIPVDRIRQRVLGDRPFPDGDDDPFVEQLPNLAETLRRYGLVKDAVALLSDHDKSDRYHLLRGDMLVELQEWRAAAEAYTKAAGKQPGLPLARFLAGLCWQKVGEEKVAAEQLRLANQLVLPPLERASIGDQLLSRHWNGEAVHQWLLVMRTVDPDSDNEAIYGYVLRKLYQSSVEEEVPTNVKLLAWRWTLWRTMEPEMFISNVGIYPYFVFQIRYQQAKQLVERDKIDEAIRAATAALEAAPAAIEINEMLVPELVRRNRNVDANRLFDHTDRLMTELCQRFPKSALYANNLAWMYARCLRKLDVAYELAQRAVKLEPESATYIDTMAEVEFCRGNPARALELAKQCVMLDPGHPHYRRQVARFAAEDSSGDGS